MIKNLLISARPRQWYKNILLFAAIVFSANLNDISMWKTVILAFIYYCMLSAGEYIVNDIIDKDRDQKHPFKRQRPIASGQLKIKHAYLFALLLITVSLLCAFFTINVEFFIISASFTVLNIVYSFILKHIIFVDILVISAGFLIRAIAGALAIDVTVSTWLVVCTFLLALFLALEKRWHELSILESAAEFHRPNLGGYSTQILDQLVVIVTAALVVSYLLYTSSFDNKAMMFTGPFAVYGLFRYLYLVRETGLRADPEAIFNDKPMLINIILWIISVVSIELWDMWH